MTSSSSTLPPIRERVLLLALAPAFWMIACVLAFRLCFPAGINRYELDRAGRNTSAGRTLIRLDRATGIVEKFDGELWAPL